MTVAMPLAKLLRVDQQTRWRRGEPVRVEAYLDSNPALRDDADGVVDLIYSEMLLREEAGEMPLLSEYLERFASFADQLRPLFEVHLALQPAPTGRTPSPTVKGLNANGFHVAPAPLSGWPIVPGYTLLGVLGQGGMGVVYRARHLGLNRVVALKALRTTHRDRATQLTRFRAEAQAVARLQHPNIVQVFEVGGDDDQPYFAMEFVAGLTLADRIGGNPQPARDAARVVATLARAVHFAHGHGVVHRDLKPANVLLTADGTAKVTDFGLAKILDDPSGPTQTGDVLGTPSYMAPEQIGGQRGKVGPAADVYALGAILYEMLTGRPPYKGETATETLYQVMAADLVPPSRLRSQTPRDLEVVCVKCLDKDAGKRYGSALALAEDLERYLDGRPIIARPLSPLGRAAKWTRRHPTVTTLLAVSTAAVLLVGMLLAFHDAGERRRLTAARGDARTDLDQGRQAFLAQDWNAARAYFDAVLARTRDEPSLADLRPEAQDLRAEADRRLGDQARERREAGVRGDFARQRDDALYYGLDSMAQGTLLTGMDPEASRQAAENAARQALTLAGYSADAGTPWELDPAFHTRREEVATDCYTLFLVLADAVAGHRRPDADRADRYHSALRVLERASALHAPTRAYYLRRAHYLEQLGDTEGARAEAYHAQGVAVTESLDYFLLGVHHARRDEIPEAVRAFENAVALQPNHFWAQCHLAGRYLNLKEWEKARAGLTTCLVERPDFVWLYLLRAYAHYHADAFTAAEADFHHAAQLLAAAPNAQAGYSLLVNRGMARLRDHKPDEAATDFRRAIELNPDHYGPYLNLAVAYRKLGQPAEAARRLDQALALDPPALVVADYHATRGRDLCLEKKYDEAVKACRLALAQRPDYAYPYLVMGEALFGLKRYDEAAHAFDRHLETGGKPFADFFRERGQARMHLGNYLGARDDYTHVLDQEPGAEIYAHRGWAYFFADAWRPALRDFDEALRRDPDYGDAFVGRGLARVMLGQYREAVADAAEAQRRKPTAPEMVHNLTCIYAQANGRVEADAAAADRADLAGRYRQAALAAIRQTLALLSPGERLPFWRDKILPDTALDPIRRTPEFLELVRENTPAAPPR